MIPQIVHLFRFRLVDPSRGWKTRNYWFNKQTDIHVFVEEREPVLDSNAGSES